MPAPTRFLRRPRQPTLPGLALAALGVASLHAWEGHDWNRWRAVSTWQKPDLRTEQSGRLDLVPLLRTNPPTADPAQTLGDWTRRRDAFQSAIRQVLGHPANPYPPPLETEDLGSVELEGYTRRHIRIRSEPDDWIPAYLLVPRPAPGTPAPAMICLHQTVAQGKDEPCGLRGDPELAFALELVRRGFVCLAPDAIGFGERIPPGTQPYHDSLAFYRRHPAWSFMGKMVWDVSRAVDCLERLPFVDPHRIGSIGHSHGAYGTLFAAAFEPRLAAAVASCGFTTFRRDPNPERWSHATALIPQLGLYLPAVAEIPFDWHHVLGLSAPRPLFVWYATQDTIFPRTENLPEAFADLQRVYALSSSIPALAWHAFEGPHKFPQSGRETAYRWLDTVFARPAATPAGAPAAPAPATPQAPPDPPDAPEAKKLSAFFPQTCVDRARTNSALYPWAARIRQSLVVAAEPWRALSDEDLWSLMFGNRIKRAWQVWSDGHCPSCRKPVPMYEWIADALAAPWKLRCPRCRELFPKNDFLAFHRSGLDPHGVFDPARANRALLFNTEHPDPADPRHLFGVDDGEGFAAEGHRWRFIGAYLVFGQWKQAVVGGIRNLAAAYLATGDILYAHKAALLLDRVADLYPTFDFGREGVMYEGPPRAGYVSTWHDACVEVHDLALAYDAIFEAIDRDPGLVRFLAEKAARFQPPYPKATSADIRRNIEHRIFRDTLANRPKIESNYPSTDITLVTLETVLGWPNNRPAINTRLDAILDKATAVDGLTGEKGIAGYSIIAPRALAELLGRFARADPALLPDTLRRHPRLAAMYRFHIDTWCLNQYYPRTGDTGSFAERTPAYAGLAFSTNPGIQPSSFAFLWDLFAATGDADFARLLFAANQSTTNGLPHDLFAPDPARFQADVAAAINRYGPRLSQPSVNKTEWGLAILRPGEPPNATAAWLDYDSGERHGHADAMTLGLFAHGLDLLPDFGYPPVQYGGWTSPRATWYTQTAAHNTVAIDGQNTRPGSGRTTLWFDGRQFHAVRAAGPHLANAQQFERTVALVGLPNHQTYLVDLFRVVGGREHMRTLQSHFGHIAPRGLDLAPIEVSRFGALRRNFRQDPAPAPGWTIDFQIDDLLHYVPDTSGIRLRLTDFTPGAQVQTAETWVSVGSFGGTGEAWIPTVLVRRTASTPPLASTFTAVLEPLSTAPPLATIRRLSLADPAGRPAPDADVGLELRHADGHRDLFLSVNPEPASPAASPEHTSPLRVDPSIHLGFDGDLCFLRLDPHNRPQRAVLCRCRSLRLDTLLIRVRDDTASLELDFAQPAAPVVTGPADALDRLEIAGTRLWPKPNP